MKSNIIVKSLLAFTVAAAIGLGAASAKDKEKEKENEAALAAQAKVSKADAEKTALAKVPGGAVKKSEIESENGVLIWSVEITIAGSKDTTEVNVDATTGAVVNVETESAGKKGKGGKEEDEKD